MRPNRYAKLATACATALVLGSPGAFAGDAFQPPEPAEGFAYPEYYCTNRGVRVDVEKTSCLTVDGRSFVAKCDISLNNPMWKATGDLCDPEETPNLQATATKN